MYHPANEETLESLIARADSAMYEVKNDGKGGYRVAPQVGESGGPTHVKHGHQ